MQQSHLISKMPWHEGTMIWQPAHRLSSSLSFPPRSTTRLVRHGADPQARSSCAPPPRLRLRHLIDVRIGQSAASCAVVLLSLVSLKGVNAATTCAAKVQAALKTLQGDGVRVSCCKPDVPECQLSAIGACAYSVLLPTLLHPLTPCQLCSLTDLWHLLR